MPMDTIRTVALGGILAGGVYGYYWLTDQFDQGTQEASARLIQASEDMEYELQEFGNLSDEELDEHIAEYEQKVQESAELLQGRTGDEYQIMGLEQAETVFGDSDKETYAFGLKLLTSQNDAMTLADEESSKGMAERVFEWIEEEHQWLGALILGGGVFGAVYGSYRVKNLVDRYTDQFRNQDTVEATSITSLTQAGVITSTDTSLYQNADQYEIQMIEAEPDPTQPPEQQPTPGPGQGVEAPAKEMNRWLPDNIVGKAATVLAIGPATVISLSGAGVDFIVNNTNLDRSGLTAGLAITLAIVIAAAIIIETGTGPIPAGVAFLTTALRAMGVRIVGSASGILSGFNSSWIAGTGAAI